MNVFDYLTWRCDVPLSVSAFNPVDNLIFSELSYTDLSGIVPADGTAIPLADATTGRRSRPGPPTPPRPPF